ncbi:MAG: N-acetylglucosamine-6-phosphate deacetylase [Erysipelotrichaceae bacterium]|nr:N-acetylglucosamine-6-phosphate deacetylase [Erysipelotrichaceae bacterium]
MKRILFTHGHLVVDGNREYEDGAILVNGETIEDVFINANHIKKDLGEYEEADLEGSIVMPGFFDTHCHGAFGFDFNTASGEELNEVSKEFLKKGTCSFFATLLNNEKLTGQLEKLDDADTGGARFLGVHLEGPFLNRKYKGAINGDFILEPSTEELERMLGSSSKIRQMTIAPELEGAREVIKLLNEKDVRVMLGHSDALKEDLEGISYDGYTHLFNAGRPFHHREMSLVNVALDDSDKYAEIIADGIHLDMSVLKLIRKNIRRDRLILISDSTLLAGTKDGECTFENERCIKNGKECRRIKDGRLAGSASFIIDGVKTMWEAGASLTDLLLMSGLNAYRLYGLESRFGTLEKGKYADMVVLDSDLDLIYTYARGERVDA